MDANMETTNEIKKPAIRFSWREWTALGLALGLAVVFMFVFSMGRLWRTDMLPGLGATVFVLAVMGASAWYIGRGASYDTLTVMLLAATVLLALTFSLFSHIFLCLLNYCAAALTGAMALMRMSGRTRRTMEQWQAVPAAIGLSIKALFVNLDKPFRAVGSLGGEGKKRLLGVLLGVVVAIPALAVVISLLSSADAVFGGLFRTLGEWLGTLELCSAIWRAVRCVAYMLMGFSAMYFLAWPRPTAVREEKTRQGAWPVPFLTVLLLLDVVYAIFVFIQFAFLFGGAEAAAMEGGYAEYARGGFFQLVAVAAINLAAVLAAATLMRREGCGRTAIWAAVLLLVMTGVILASAVMRMTLYISVYGLSMLRVLTLWAMAMIGVGLLAAGLKLWKPEVKFFPVFFAACLSTWIVFNYVNPVARIAQYNVSAYLSGSVQQADTEYLGSLGPESIPALKRLAEASPENAEAAKQAASSAVMVAEHMGWREWRLSYALNAKK